VYSTGPPGWGLGVVLTTPPHKKVVMKPQRKKRGGPVSSRTVEPQREEGSLQKYQIIFTIMFHTKFNLLYMQA
jgi:hypothetical protein